MKTIRIKVEGIVQGVGFRPFLHRLASRNHICGWVRNTSAGLEGILEGEPEELERFIEELRSSPPPMAQIEAVRVENADAASANIDADPAHAGASSPTAQPSGTFKHFTIRDSRIKAGATLISPDTAMCPECEAELYTPSDRRYRYPFINCTNCGPRYTIIEALPYDRERTVMKAFPMCGDCENEYNDISDRRYHAQPDCCPECGPEVFYIKSLEKPADPSAAPVSSSQSVSSTLSVSGDVAFRRSQELLADGGILAVKGIGGIHLACDALDPDAVYRLRGRKHRAEKPLAVMCRSLEAARRICEITSEEEKLLTSPARPIVLLAKRTNRPGAHTSHDVQDPQDLPDSQDLQDLQDSQTVRELDALSFSARLGVMLPYTPLHTLLLDSAYGGPDILVMTSGNVPGCPVLTDNDAALDALSGVADGFLLHNRRIANRCDDSLIAEWQGRPYFLRRSRGYAPRPLELRLSDRTDGSPAGTVSGSISANAPSDGSCTPISADGIFALGAEQKASFALGRDSHIFLSPYIGDLKNAETFEHYTQAMQTYERLFRLKPALYVCDLHPDYLSTGEAIRRAASDHVPLLQVQHHRAHMASCMADNNLSGPCFGIIWDGTGLGTDGTIWGGEFFIGDYENFQRAGSIRPILLPGSDRAVREIGRIALSLTTDAGIRDFSRVPLTEEKCRMLSGLMETSPQSVPAASSIGRLFDGVCALLLDRSEVDYEGEGAALVEALSPAETPEQLSAGLRTLAYPVTFYEKDGIRIFDTRPMIRSLIDELDQHRDKRLLALRFMSTLVCMAADQCMTLNPDRLPVVLSGGVFQNRFLLHGVASLLEEKGFTVYTHHRVSPNDEGIALGQLAIAGCRRKATE